MCKACNYAFKGLEFKVVIIAGLNSKVMPSCPVKNEEEDMDMLESRERKVENVRPVPIFNEIAAGIPILINDELQGKYYLPSEWVGNSNDVFILKIKRIHFS